MTAPALPPPLSLYLHVPWCVRKCPYCDFNSHEAGDALPEREYLDALLADLELELPLVWGRRAVSLFIGGGTPSLLTPAGIDRLLAGVRARLPLPPGSEITLEANPGTVEAGRFAEFRAAGITRLSLGVQSFDDRRLRAIGRIHGRAEALAAAEAARAAGFDDLNLDLMFGLPGQEAGGALDDLRTALALEPSHLSWYQLTVEPNTAFAQRPPPLPDDDALWRMQERGQQLLATAGFDHYEISAYARPGQRCRHNLNYWHFGDYLGIGAGAHGKLSLAGPDGRRVVRRHRLRHPRDYLAAAGGPAAVAGERVLEAEDLALEFLMNALRLSDGFEETLLPERTGVEWSALAVPLAEAEGRGLIERGGARVRASDTGLRYLNDLLGLFL